MTGVQFERYLQDLLGSQGYRVSLTRASGDLGVDLIACRAQDRIAIQVKRHNANVSRRAISDAVAGMQHYRCNRAMVITNSHFTPGAIVLARSTSCTLVNRDRLAQWILQFQAGKSLSQSKANFDATPKQRPNIKRILPRGTLRIVLLWLGLACFALWLLSRLPTIQSPQSTYSSPLSTPTITVSSTPVVSLPQASAKDTPSVQLKNTELASAAPQSSAPRAVPAYVILRAPVFFKVGDSKRSDQVVAIPVGTKVRIVKVDGLRLQIERDGKYKYVPISDTDYSDRLSGKVR